MTDEDKEARVSKADAEEATLGMPKRAMTLMSMHPYDILIHMRTTLIIDDELLAKAQQLTGLREKTAILHAGLKALIVRENVQRDWSC